MEFSLLNIVSIITSFQAILFAIYLLSNNPKKHPSSYFMAVFLLAYGIDFAAFFSAYYIYPVAPNTGLFLSTTLYLAPPSFFFYIKSSLYSDFRLKRKDIYNLLPFVLINLLFFPFYYLPNINGELAPSNAELIFVNYIIPVNYVLLHVQGIIYLIASYIVLKRYKKLFLENFSNVENNKYRYLLQLILILAITDSASIIKNYVMFNVGGPLYEYALIFVNLFALIMVCWLVYKALKSPELFTGIHSDLQSVDDILKDNKKIWIRGKESGYDGSDENIWKIKSHMEESSAYLDASLSLETLASQMNISSKELSILINHKMGLHFFDFVNEYRINHAKDILSDKDQKDLTVLEILYEVGFNSKSSFNTEFKKRTGLTPTDYRRKYLLSDS
jgi:AraC-like DNA-binding protein